MLLSLFEDSHSFIFGQTQLPVTRYHTLFLLALSLLLVNPGCKKDQENRVPNVPVDITLNLNLPSQIDLTVVSGWAYVSGGSRGIIVYRLSQEEFIAVDRHCPYEVDNADRVFVEDNGQFATDTLVCGSSFSLVDGLLSNGPASFPLTRYQTTFNGTTNVLRIFN